MKCSDLKSKIRKNRPAIRCLVLLTVLSVIAALALQDYAILPIVSGLTETDANPDASTDSLKKLIAHYTFDNADDRLADLSGNENGAHAEILNQIPLNDIMSTDNTSYLDLTDRNSTANDAYLSLPGEILADLTEFSVEMRVRTDSTATNWAFFAAPNDMPPQGGI